jgi:hypothetical protein
MTSRTWAAAIGSALCLMAPQQCWADDAGLHGVLGMSYNSHYVSYGSDVWAGGDNFFGKQAVSFLSGLLSFKWDAFTADVSLFATLKDPPSGSVSANVQEVDASLGGAYSFGSTTVSAHYQEWRYLGDSENIVDLGASFDDSSLVGRFHPAVLWHVRIKGNGAQREGSALVASIAPGLPIGESGLYASIPAGVGFFLTDDFKGGTKSGYAYSYVGASLDIPLHFIPSDYGAWTVNLNTYYYMTDSAALPSNVAENFATGSFGLRVAF